MSEIVNLRQARKAKARAAAQKTAAENRRRFGVSRAEREFAEAQRALAENRLDQHLLSPVDADAPKIS